MCVGRTSSSANASSLFTTDFYIADRGNGRLAWLRRTGSGATWMGTATMLGGWDPVSCSVDHFGNVYVADRQNSRLVKYSWNLTLITTYGSYGTGATNYNTFANPHDVHVPFGKKTVNGQTVWYGDGRILTAEQWGPNSGGLEHWLGVEVKDASATGGAFGSSVNFRTTDHANVSVSVSPGTHSAGDPTYKDIWVGFFRAPTWHTASWDGTGPSGNQAPAGTYHFHVSALSAYGCSGQPFCSSSVGTNSFAWQPCEDPESPECNPPELNVALPLDAAVEGSDAERLPQAFRLGQAITPYVGPLFRVEGSGGAAVAGGVSDVVASVRARGIRALVVDVPAGREGTRVTVRIYDLTGRLVRKLADETVDPGSYVVGWDGEGDARRPVRPGVYLAVMTAEGYRGIQRLLLK